MQNNLGYFFYKRLYNVSNAGLTINSQNKKLLLDRTIDEQEKKYAIECPDFIKLYTTYPGLATGTGMPHGVKDQNDDFKIGFYFDYTTGLPLLPGSSVKGVLRSAFPDIKKNIKDDGTVEFVFEKRTNAETNCVKACWIQALLNGLNKDGLKEDYYEPVESVTPEQKKSIYALVMAVFEGVKDHTKSVPREKYYSIYQRDIFHDAIITGAGKQEKIVGTDSITPHIREGEPYHKAMLRNPTPLLFLKVLPNVEFSFNFSLTYNGLPKDEKLKLFKHILLTIGAGAKTNVGYGQFTETSANINNAGAVTGGENVKKTRMIQDIPDGAATSLKETSSYSGSTIGQDDLYNLYEFQVDKYTCRLIKKKEKNPDLKVGDKVEIIFKKDYDRNQPNFQVKKT